VFIPFTLDEPLDRARYRLIDVVLDTLPYTGGDTTAVALDMGVPVVTRVGERAAERMTYSLLAHLGVTDTLAGTDDDYVAIACRLASDAAWRKGVGAAIAARLPVSGLADLALHSRARVGLPAHSISRPARPPETAEPCSCTSSAFAARSWAASRRSRAPPATR
jgi:predicted O-linked N-acetylglucosamine transferase (SPINDLY family)